MVGLGGYTRGIEINSGLVVQGMETGMGVWKIE